MNKPAHDFAVLLCNLGTPDQPTKQSVRAFLKRFLSDTRVVDLSPWLWQPLLRGVILPLRVGKVSKLYRSIWLEQGSPLAVYSQSLVDKLQMRLAKRAKVVLAMSYSQPDIQHCVQELVEQGYERILLLPMYPQYSVTTTAPVFDAYHQACQNLYALPSLRSVNHYYAHEAYIDALSAHISRHWQTHGRSEMLVFSFHGIPQRYANNGDPYPQHCEKTAESVAQKLGLTSKQWRLAYQSRFGKEPWLQPYTDGLLQSLGAQGVNSVDIISPAFAADCLETIEELGQELREVFLTAGGKQYHYIPALNDSEEHIALFEQLVAQHSRGW